MPNALGLRLPVWSLSACANTGPDGSALNSTMARLRGFGRRSLTMQPIWTAKCSLRAPTLPKRTKKGRTCGRIWKCSL